MKKFYDHVCTAEAWVAAVFLILMVILIFLGGVMRMLGHPINWSSDAATALFAWACFLCADIAWRRNSLMAIEVLTDRLPERLAFRVPHDQLRADHGVPALPDRDGHSISPGSAGRAASRAFRRSAIRG